MASTALQSAHVCMAAYLLDPRTGSEPRNAWAWMDQMAPRVGRVSLVTSPAGGDRIRSAQGDGWNLPANVSIHLATATGPAMLPPVPGWYRDYAGWLDAAAVAVRDVRADLSHHVMVGTPFWGSSLASASGPRLLGPVGISHVPPLWTATHWGPAEALGEVVRGALGRSPRLWQRGHAGLGAADFALVADPRSASLATLAGTAWAKELLEGVEAVRGSAGARPPVMVWAGKLVRRKAPFLAIRAWGLAAPELPRDSRLRIFGAGPLDAEVRSMVHELGLTGSVSVEGPVPNSEVLVALRSARGLLFTSLRDTSSSQMLEAAAMGTPTVSLRHAGVRGLDYWYPASAGWGAAARSGTTAVRSLAHSLKQCLSASPDQWLEKSRASIELASLQTWDAKGDRMADTYHRMLST